MKVVALFLVLSCVFAEAVTSIAVVEDDDRRRSRHITVGAGGVEYDWTEVDAILVNAIQNGTFPGCAAAVADESGYIYNGPHGYFTYGAVPPMNYYVPEMTLDTRFDMASLTKIVSTTSAVFTFYQRGELPLDTKIYEILGPGYATYGKEKITVLNCMLHNAGYPPDPNPNYWNITFGCPETSQPQPAENFSCQTRCYYSLLNQTLINPVGEVFVYSDLSMITMMYVVGNLARNLGYVTAADLYPGCDTGGPGIDQCYYEAYVRMYVFEYLNMTKTGFLPDVSLWGECAPTENDTVYLHREIQGQVSDGNSYALGGIAGHAGLFSTVNDASLLLHQLMFGNDQQVFGNQTTVKLFTTVYNVTQSSRAIGWDTNNYQSQTFFSCGNLSSSTYLHLGYTGTQFCNDPVRKIYTLFFTNRVYQSALNLKIENVRIQFNTAVKEAFDAGQERHAAKLAALAREGGGGGGLGGS